MIKPEKIKDMNSKTNSENTIAIGHRGIELPPSRPPKPKGRRRIKLFIDRNNFKLLWLAIGLYFIFFVLASFWKYNHFGYDGIDLAIYNQVFYNTSQGRLFNFSINPHSYLGDHFEIFILPLTLIYLVFKSPLTLLVLQSLVLGLASWPLYLIAKRALNKNWAFLLAVLYLLNPLVWNINFFEFHLLPFGLFFLFFAIYFYQTSRFKLFLFFSLFSLAVREDVSLVIMMFGVLAMIDRRSLKWIMTTLVVGGAWLLASFKLIALFNHYGYYKYLALYAWLGETWPAVIKNVFLHPVTVFSHVFNFNELQFLLIIFLPFVFLPFLKPKYLILALPIFVQTILRAAGIGPIVAKTHYVTLYLPALFLATIFSLQWLYFKPLLNLKDGFKKFLVNNRHWLLGFLVLATLYTNLTWGPTLTLFKRVVFGQVDQELVQLKKDVLKMIFPQASIIAGYEFLPNLSSREKLYLFHYLFKGKQQFSNQDYVVPDNTNSLLIDFQDLLSTASEYEFKIPKIYEEGAQRIRKLLIEKNFKLEKVIDNFAYFKNGGNENFKLYETLDSYPLASPVSLGGKINFLGWDQLGQEKNDELFLIKDQVGVHEYQILPLSLAWQAKEPLQENYQLQLEFIDSANKPVHQKIYPLAYGLYPTVAWPTDEVIRTNYWFLIPKTIKTGRYSVKVGLYKIKASLYLDQLGSTYYKVEGKDLLGEEIKIGEITI